MNDWKSKYNRIEYIGEGLYKASHDNPNDPEALWVVVNDSGEELTPFEYNNVFSFVEGLFRVEKNFLYGVINTKGENVIPCEFESVRRPDGNFSKVFKNDKYGIYDIRGKKILSCKYKLKDIGHAFILIDGEPFKLEKAEENQT